MTGHVQRHASPTVPELQLLCPLRSACTHIAGCLRRAPCQLIAVHCRLQRPPDRSLGLQVQWDNYRVEHVPPGWRPLLVFLNTKSGPQLGARMRRRFLRCLNPLQVQAVAPVAVQHCYSDLVANRKDLVLQSLAGMPRTRPSIQGWSGVVTPAVHAPTNELVGIALVASCLLSAFRCAAYSGCHLSDLPHPHL